MKVLVTGATGFVGSHIADQLLERDFEVRAIARKTSNLRWIENKRIDIVYSSLSDMDSLISAVKGVDIIIHSAGLTAARNLDGYIKGNKQGTLNLLEATQKYNPEIKRFLFVSSLTAVGPSKSASEPVDEKTKCNPITSYGKSKMLAEEVVANFMNEIPVTIVRPPAVYGPRDTATFDIFKTINMGLAAMIGFDKKLVSLIHVSDLARGIIDASLSEKSIGETYFISSEKFYEWEILNSYMAEGIGKEKYMNLRLPHFLIKTLAGISEVTGRFSSKLPVFNLDKGRDFVQSYWTCSIEKAKRDLGFREEIDIKDGLISTGKWYKDEGWLK